MLTSKNTLKGQFFGAPALALPWFFSHWWGLESIRQLAKSHRHRAPWEVPFKDMAHFTGNRREVKVLDCLHLACGRCLQAILQTDSKEERPLCPLCDSQIKEGNLDACLTWCLFYVMLVFPNVNHSGNLEFQFFPFFGGSLQAKPKETTTNSCVILRKTRASISEQLAAPLTASVATNASMRILRFSTARSASKGCAPNAVNITVGRKPRHHIRWPNWRNNRNIHFTELPCVPVITESWNSFVRVAMWCAAVTVSQQNTKLASLFQTCCVV